jgi:hypothetical protein
MIVGYVLLDEKGQEANTDLELEGVSSKTDANVIIRNSHGDNCKYTIKYFEPEP